MADGIAVLALVRQHGAGIAIALLHQSVVSRHIMGFALAEYDPDGETCGVATHVVERAFDARVARMNAANIRGRHALDQMFA
jgi:hypothetical protein